jgi:hypothetical protein
MHGPTHATAPDLAGREGERGVALILALMVSLVLVFLGLGLLLQTSLGLQASGTDRWVTKALYAADAGAMMQIGMLQRGQLGAPSSFTLTDDPSLPGLLKTQFTVTISDFCETETATYGEQSEGGDLDSGYHARFFHFRSVADRDLGDLAGLTRAAVEADVSAQPFKNDEFVIVGQCY